MRTRAHLIPTPGKSSCSSMSRQSIITIASTATVLPKFAAAIPRSSHRARRQNDHPKQGGGATHSATAHELGAGRRELRLPTLPREICHRSPPNTAGPDPGVRGLRSGAAADGKRRLAALRARRRLISRGGALRLPKFRERNLSLPIAYHFGPRRPSKVSYFIQLSRCNYAHMGVRLE